MDPLVRLALATQQLLARTAGALFAVGFGAFVVYAETERVPDVALYGVGSLFAVSLGYRILQRQRRAIVEETARLDLELFTHLVVLAFAVVLRTRGGLEGAAYPVLYALVMLTASFARPSAAVATVGFAVLLESALTFIAFRGRGNLIEHATLLGVFAFLNMLVFRAEIARIRRVSRQRIETELKKMKEAARSYRLIGAPTGAQERTQTQPKGDEERLLRSGVDEIHQAVEFALSLLRRTLGLRTAVLLGTDAALQNLHIQELSSSEDAILPGPFGVRDGIFGAVLSKLEQLSLAGPKSGQHVPYYSRKPAIGSVCCTPLLDHGHPRGLLVVDRESREPFTEQEQATLAGAARYILRAIENERVFVQLERAKVEQGKLYRAANALAAATTEAQVIEAGVNGAREFAAFDFAVVTLFDRSTSEHEICAVSGDGANELVGQRFKHNSGLV